MEIKTIIERRWIQDRLYWFSSSSFKLGDGWGNFLYINFFKEDFPWLSSPGLIDCSWRKSGKRFEYNNCDIATLDWHCGLTFYEEVFCPETGRTRVRAGADYQHLYDEDYQRGDNGELILKHDAPLIAMQFERMNERLSNKTQQG